jgi:hypothetical protein
MIDVIQRPRKVTRAPPSVEQHLFILVTEDLLIRENLGEWRIRERER